MTYVSLNDAACTIDLIFYETVGLSNNFVSVVSICMNILRYSHQCCLSGAYILVGMTVIVSLVDLEFLISPMGHCFKIYKHVSENMHKFCLLFSHWLRCDVHVICPAHYPLQYIHLLDQPQTHCKVTV